MTSRSRFVSLLSIIAIAGGIWLFKNLRRFSASPHDSAAPDTAATPSPDSTDRARLEAELNRQMSQINPQGDHTWPESTKAAQAEILKRFAAGDYGATLSLARQAMDEKSHPDSFKLWLRDQMAAILTSLGWLELKQKNCEQALQYFEESDRYQIMPESLKGAGYCRYQLKDSANSASLLRQYLETQPGDATVRILYADALESLGRFREAAQSLEQITSDGLTNLPISADELSKRVKSMRAKIAEGDEQTVQNFNQFVISYRADLHDDLLPMVTETLDSSLQEFVDQYGFSIPKANIEVILYPAENFQNVVSYGPEWAQGIFDGRMRIPIAADRSGSTQIENLRRVLRHELVHALTAEMTNSRSLPNWFNEGLAQRLECSGECGTFKFPPGKNAILTKSKLESNFNLLEKPAARVAYLQSHYLVLTLEQEMGIESALRKIIGNLAKTQYFTSDQILRPTGIRFDQLHSYAGKLWDSQKNITISDQQ
jgi:tetratricopeptide (TPR) repeat protein